MELEQSALEVHALEGNPRRRVDLRRLQRRRIILRSQLLALERRLEELSGEHKPLDVARAIAAAQANGYD